MRKLFIAQHSETIVEQLQHTLQDEWEIHICMDSYPVIDMMQYMQPDAMILDLNIGPKDGIALLKEGQPFLPPVVVATSNYADSKIINIAESLGVGALVRIPFRPEYIKAQLDYLTANCKESMSGISRHLRALGVNPKLSGYHCLYAGIQLLSQNPNLLLKEVYPEVSRICKISDTRRVERVIRTAIYNAWIKRNHAIWIRYFPANDHGDIDKPTNKAFMLSISVET